VTERKNWDTALRRRGRRLLEGIIGFTLRAAPVRPTAVVHGWPDHEENSLRVAAALARDYAGRTVLLADDPLTASRALDALGPNAGDRPIVVRKSGWRPLAEFLSARFVFYTHGLYGSPRPGRRRTHVNLWHGHGPKRTANPSFSQRAESTFLVTNTPVWGAATAATLGLPPAAVLDIGNPRQDAFDEPASRELLRRLDIDPERPLVLWLPTFRRTNLGGRLAWRDAPDVAGEAGFARLAEAAVSAARRHDVTLVVKPHPFDADSFSDIGARILTSQQMLDAGVLLYGLLSTVDGLLSDYSSVWAEFLELDRPLGLVCPDIEAYEARRGFKVPTLREVGTRLILNLPAEVEDFFRNVAGGYDAGSLSRRDCARALAIRPRRERTLTLLSRVGLKTVTGI
jgi:hypothetical protein